MKLLPSVSFGLLVSVPKMRHASIELSHMNLMNDLKSLNSRKSKLQKSRAMSEDKTMNWKTFLENNSEYLHLYSYEDSGTCTGPLSTLVTKVGPIRRFDMEQMIARHPRLLSNILLSDMETIRTCSSQISADLQMNSSQIKKLRSISHRVRTYRGNIRSITTYLESRLQMDKASIATMILKRPELLNYSIHKISISIEYFLSKGFAAEEIAKMIILSPVIMAYSTSSKIEPILKFFEDDLQIVNYHKIVARYPQVFSVKVVRLMERAQFLQSNLELIRSPTRSEWLDVSFVISGFPPVLWLSEHNLLEKVEFIRNEFDFESEELRDVLVTFPQVLGLAVDKNLRPKIDFLLLSAENGGAGLTKEHLKEFVLYQPALLAYSLEARIKPRIKCLNENSISFEYCPPYLMSYTNTKFDQW